MTQQLSVTNQIWRAAPMDRASMMDLSRGLEIEPLVAHLLTCRAITGVEQGRAFLNPSVDQLSDPLLLTDLRAAATRIEAARRDNERVLVFGDYDVDGMAGTALLVSALRRFGIAQCSYGLPSRLVEGYGLSPDRVEAAQRDGVTLIVTVDNGINARDAATTARRLGVDLIVTDHHALEGDLPDAVAVVDPLREPATYPGAGICGAGVAFKLAQALTGAMDDLDIVALGTVADVVPLCGENRVLTALGLAQMAREPRVGLLALASIAGVNVAEVTAEHIAFQLAPRLNAAARLGDPLISLDLLLTDSAATASRAAAKLHAANERRRTIDSEIYDEAVEMIEATLHDDERSIVLGSRDWHPGVVGIVASRIQETYQRPALLIAIDDDGLGRGSGRSIQGFDLVAALSACQAHLDRFGGHVAAAGIVIREESIPAFREAFEAAAVQQAPEEKPVRTLEVDALLSLSEIDGHMIRACEKLQPFGHGNPAPVFYTCGVRPMPDSVRELQGRHLRFVVKQGPASFPVIGFGMAGLLPPEATSRPIDIAFTPQFNTWRGETTIQLLLKDLRLP